MNQSEETPKVERRGGPRPRKRAGDRRSLRSGRGGAREGAGRPKGIPNRSTLAFRNFVREYTDYAVDLHAEVMQNKKLDYRLRMEAARWLVDRGYGKAPQQITDPDDGPVQAEYHNFDEVRAALLAKGIDYDRLPLPRMFEHHMNNNATKNGSNGTS
jgi:hypothetical protein